MARQKARIVSNKSNNGQIVQRLKTYVIEELGLPNGVKHTHLTDDALTIHARTLFETGQPDSGFAELHSAINNNMINAVAIDENLILVSHGAPPYGLSRPKFGNYTPAQLANILAYHNIIPNGYAGEIYLDGCNTAKGESNSFAFQLKLELTHINRNFANVKIKGNLNTVFTTHSDGKDYSNIDEDKDNRFLINMQGYAHSLIGTPNAVRGIGRYEAGICMTKTF